MRITLKGLTLNFDEFQTVSDLATGHETILFLHGWGGSAKSLRGLAEIVSPSSRKILIDLPGFGESDHPPHAWGVGEYTNLVEEFIDQMGFGDVTLIGHSFGATIALGLAASHHKNIRKVVLCAPSYRRAQKPTPSLLSRIAKPVFDKFPLVKRGVYAVFYPHSDYMRFPHLQENFKKILYEDSSEEAKKVKIPTLIVWGSADIDTPLDDAHLLHSLIPHSQIEVYQGFTHGLPVRYPDVIGQKVNEFLMGHNA